MWDGIGTLHSHVIWLAGCAAKLCSLSRTPRWSFQRLQLNDIMRCGGWEDSINGVADEVIHKQLFSWMYRCT